MPFFMIAFVLTRSHRIVFQKRGNSKKLLPSSCFLPFLIPDSFCNWRVVSSTSISSFTVSGLWLKTLENMRIESSGLKGALILFGNNGLRSKTSVSKNEQKTNEVTVSAVVLIKLSVERDFVFNFYGFQREKIA